MTSYQLNSGKLSKEGNFIMLNNWKDISIPKILMITNLTVGSYFKFLGILLYGVPRSKLLFREPQLKPSTLLYFMQEGM